MNTGKVTYGTMKNILRDMEVFFGATVTPPAKVLIIKELTAMRRFIN